jgi:hypothetical protein
MSGFSLGIRIEISRNFRHGLEKDVSRQPTTNPGLKLPAVHQFNTQGSSMINSFVLKYLKTIEMTGVIMRISSFSLVSWLGPHSPFLFVWIFNTCDAVVLSWCAALRKDAAYTLLNVF